MLAPGLKRASAAGLMSDGAGSGLVDGGGGVRAGQRCLVSAVDHAGSCVRRIRDDYGGARYQRGHTAGRLWPCHGIDLCPRVRRRLDLVSADGGGIRGRLAHPAADTRRDGD